MNIKREDNVIIITGKDKGKTGKVIKSFPKKELIVVSGVNLRKRHQKARKQGQKGQVIEQEAPIHVSNVKLVSAPAKEKPAKVAKPVVKKEKKETKAKAK